MKYFSEALFLLGLLAAIMICHGDPDILDGLIKRANNVACQAVENG